MRGRLIVTFVTLLFVVVVGLTVPLAITLAGHASQELLINRREEAVQFASLAATAFGSSQQSGMHAVLRDYDQRWGVAVAVVSVDRQPVVVSRREIDLSGELVGEVLEQALAGQSAYADHIIYPWHGRPLAVAEPVWRDGEVLAAVVTLSPTREVRDAILGRWAALAGGSVLVLVAGAVTVVPLSNWMLRPVRRLDRAAHALAAGRFTDRVLPESGPPELRRLTASFNTMAEQLATLVERQRSFASYASHQLRAPLATLRLWVENLGPSVLPAGQDDHRLVSAEIDRLGEMCDALLAYAQAELTADDVTELDAGEVADARVAVWSQAARQAGVRLVRAGGWRTWVQAAPQALDQVLDALLSNAVSYAGRGNQVLVTVDKVLKVNGAGSKWVDINVIDDGPGLPAADLDRAAQPFWRGAGHQNLAGSGLGITIADALVTASGGRLDLLPAQPHGLHARVRLPAVPTPAPPAPPGPAGQVGPAGPVAPAAAPAQAPS